MVDLGIAEKTVKGVELVIFDKDGTLVELYNYWSKMVGRRVELARERLGYGKELAEMIMYAMGVDTSAGMLRPNGPVGLKKRETVMQAMVDTLEANGYPETLHLCEEVFGDVDAESIAHLSELIKPVEGLYPLISALRKNGCRIAVATTDITERAQVALKHLGIAGSVDAVAGQDRVARPKPAPDMVELILEELNVAREKTVVVGDAITDVEMGINAGVLASIGVESGLTPREELLAKTPLVIKDISGIKVLRGSDA